MSLFAPLPPGPPPSLGRQVFVGELCLSLFARWFWRFFGDAWHVFDLFVIVGGATLFFDHLAHFDHFDFWGV